jgi:FKBP-type peptidyl-prolyl cis-trans isomerase
VGTNKQRRDVARRKLERQLIARQERAKRRRQTNVIASVVGTLVVIAVVVTFIVFTNNDKKKSTASTSGTSASTTASATASAATTSAAPTTTYPAAKGAAVAFDGITITGAADLKGRPGVTSKGKLVPKAVLYKDLVVGKGAAATTKDTVTIQYIGALYKNGKIFDESWKRGAPTSFPLTGVVKGFSEGIAGVTGKIPAMKIGGRRVIIIPSALGYGKTAQSTIPANSTLVFVIDLKKAAA